MRRILLALCTTATALVLLFGYRTSTGAALSTPPVVTAAAPSGTTSSSGTTSGSGTTADSGTGSGSSGSTTATSASYAGDVVQTRWGPVQVTITVVDGKVTAADVLQVPSGNHRDEEINAAAVPVLNSEAVAAQSASIDSVSGATVTSDGYATSLQSALDAANL